MYYVYYMDIWCLAVLDFDGNFYCESVNRILFWPHISESLYFI